MATESRVEQSFEQLAGEHRRALHVHCYRMLGSLDDADDAVQETLIRAWRSIDRFEPRAKLSTWLHAIATNVCLTALDRRRRRPELPAAEELAWSDGELLHVQPYPDSLLDDLVARETVELAFITAVQLLPPKQRAVLLLRDVLGWSAKETAEALDDTVPAVNSALQRARATLDRARPLGARAHKPAAEEHALLQKFVDAWEAVDIDRLVSLFAEDAVMTMPPEPAYFSGAATIGEFFATVPQGGRLDEIRLVATAANRQPALAAYVRGEDGAYRGYGVMVLAIADDRIAGIVGFADPAVFERFGLPPLAN
jgi:RNA polymerase sigma-70 factor (ECF subfamily)